MLDTSNTVIGLSLISVRGLAASIVEPRQIFKTAILANLQIELPTLAIRCNHEKVHPIRSIDGTCDCISQRRMRKWLSWLASLYKVPYFSIEIQPSLFAILSRIIARCSRWYSISRPEPLK